MIKLNIKKDLDLLKKKIKLFDLEEEVVLITDEPKIPSYLCFPNKEKDRKYFSEESFGQGFDLNKNKARIKSIAEFLERLCLYNFSEENVIISKYKKGNKFIDPALFCCYSKEQLKNLDDFIEQSRNEIYRWWPVKNLESRETVFIPAQIIFLSPVFDDEFPIRKERISTGAAFGPLSTNFAFKNGFMEVVERDACIYSYLTKREINKIVNLPKDLTELVDYLKRYQLEPNIFDVTTDLEIPTVLTITLDKTGIGAAVNVGSRSDLNYNNAIKYSILESIHCRRTSRILRQQGYQKKLPSENNITSMDDRFYYWCSLDRIKDLGFWLESNNTIDYTKLFKNNISMKKAIKNVEERNFHIFIADISLPEIKKNGFQTLKIMIPELHPLYLDERAKALYSPHYGIIKNNLELKPHPLT